MRLTAFLLILSAGTVVAAPSPQPTYSVSPARIHLSDRSKNTDVELRNLSDVTRKFRLSVVFYRFPEDGTPVEVPYARAGERSALRWLRVTERSLVVAPQTRRLVRISYLTSPDLLAGDYRAHLKIVPEPLPLPPPESEKIQGTTIRMRLRSEASLAVPIIVRQGLPIATVLLGRPTLVTIRGGAPGYQVHASVDGSALPYGDLELFLVEKGKRKSVSLMRGVSLYWPERLLSFPLSESLRASPGARLVVEFRRQPEDGGTVIAVSEETSVEKARVIASKPSPTPTPGPLRR